jgi:hypothetical protein
VLVSESKRRLLEAVRVGEVRGFDVRGSRREVWVQYGTLDTPVVTGAVTALAAAGLVEQTPDAAGISGRWGWKLSRSGRAVLRTHPST